MGNYVVQSGSVRRTVQADDARKAALWTVHLAMEHQLPTEGDLEPPLRDVKLGRNIRVLRADGLEAGCWPIYEILIEWNQLLVALRRLETMLDQDEQPPCPSADPPHAGTSPTGSACSAVETEPVRVQRPNPLGSLKPMTTSASSAAPPQPSTARSPSQKLAAA